MKEITKETYLKWYEDQKINNSKYKEEL